MKFRIVIFPYRKEKILFKKKNILGANIRSSGKYYFYGIKIAKSSSNTILKQEVGKPFIIKIRKVTWFFYLLLAVSMS